MQLVCGGVGDLLDHLGGEDIIAFTGSASTAATLRGTRRGDRARDAIQRRDRTRSTARILGPDAVAGTPEFDLFVKEVAREITTKAGQRCTCIRRALVPEVGGRRCALRTARTPRQGRRRQPAQRDGHHGLARQPASARRGSRCRQRADPRGATSCTAIPMSVDPVDADPQRGAFMAPVVLLCNDVRPLGTSRDRGVRSGDHAHPVPRAPASVGADRGPRRRQPRRLGRLVRPRFRPRRRDRGGAVSRPPARARPRLRRGVDRARERRCRRWSTAARAAPVAARSSAGCAPSGTSCSAPRCRARRR